MEQLEAGSWFMSTEQGVAQSQPRLCHTGFSSHHEVSFLQRRPSESTLLQLQRQENIFSQFHALICEKLVWMQVLQHFVA